MSVNEDTLNGLTGTVAMADKLRPELESGTYKLGIQQELKVDGEDSAYGAILESRIIEVEGPRFVIGQDHVVNQYPPPSSSDWFGDALPHIVLDRPTLPWERHALCASDSHERLPWLALIALPVDAEELETVPMSLELLGELGLAMSPDTTPDEWPENVRLLQLNDTQAARLLPDGRSLKLGAHVRWRGDTSGAENARSVIVGTRPLPVGHIAFHLISFEGRTVDKSVASSRRFISLLRWEANVLARKSSASFARLALELKAQRFGGVAPTSKDPAFDTQSMQLLPHNLRSGERTVSFYRGPLVPDMSALPEVSAKSPVYSPDELLVIDEVLGLIDASYAAAWELGRLLILSRPAIAAKLAAWKRAHARHKACCEAMEACAHLPHECAPDAVPDFTPIGDYIENDLGLLVSVPFGYLVPSAGLLPPETMRFFDIDPTWMTCLQEGALAIGRARKANADTEMACCEQAHAEHRVRAVSGLLLRSRLVAGWPDLMLDATGKDGAALSPLRNAKIGQQTLLLLFAKPIKSVRMHLHPHGLHFEKPVPKPDTPDLLENWNDLTLADIADRLEMGAETGAAALGRQLLSGTPNRTFFAHANSMAQT